MKFPAGLNSNNHQHNIARALVAAAGVCLPSAGIAGKPAIPTAQPPVAAIAAVLAVTGIMGYGTAFRLVAVAGGTELIAEIPYSPRVYALTADLQAAIAEVPGSAALMPASKTYSDAIAITAPKSLEAYLLSEFTLANGAISLGYDVLTKRAFILCKLTVAESLQDLLTVAGAQVP